MDAERPDIKEIFCTAVEKKSRAERDAYLRQACGGDEELRADVEALLKAHDAVGSFLESPPAGTNTTLDTSPLTEGPGTKIGRYKLLQLIGEGGFGVVYMAEQEKPIHRWVALKIIKLGMDTKQVIARFEAERQALAMMSHPNIAGVLDAGATDTGRPYFVMELVKGVPITEYCDKNNLDTKQRLELFIDVCKAVQHAHQKGIIHRDIKPSNVMITLHDGRPVPKIIDFGIAKATQHRLTEKTLFTEYRQFIGTPEYMSPEQAEMSGLDVDTRSDIYSLGVLLYELLTGTTPFEAEKLRSAAYDEIRRIIREDEPPRPSTRLSTLGEPLTDIARHRNAQPSELRRIVRGDLDWVVMKALEKDRTRRYETANEFALDIGRHLGDEPVVAGPPSTVYRARKFIRRHRTAVASGLLVATAIMAGLVVSTVMYFQAEQARQKESAAHAEAERQAMISKAVNEFLNKDLLASVDPDKAKSREITVTEILDNAAKKLEGKFTDAPSVEASIRYSLGTAYYGLGKYEAAEPHLERAIELYRGQFGAEHPDTLVTLVQLGWLYSMQGRRNEAEPLFIKALETRQRVLGEEHPDTLNSMANLGWLYSVQNRYKEAEPLLVRALETQQRELGEEHPDTTWSMHNLGAMYTTQGRYKEAEPLLAKSLEIYRRVLGEEKSQTLWTMGHLGNLYNNQGRYKEAEPLLVKTLEIRRRILGEEHPDTLWSMQGLGLLYRNQGRYKDVESLLVKALEGRQRVLGEENQDTFYSMGDLGDLYRTQGRYKEAEKKYREWIDIYKKLVKEFPAQVEYRERLGHVLNDLCGVLWETGQVQEAEDAHREAISHWEELTDDHPDIMNYMYFGNSLLLLGEMLEQRDRPVEAEQACQKALSVFTKVIELDPNRSDPWHRHADTYWTMHQWDKALADFSKAVELNPGKPDHWHRRADTYRELKQWDKAIDDYSKAIELNPGNPGHLHNRAVTHREMKQWDKSLADFNSAIELEPNNSHNWHGRADTFWDMQDWDKALADFSKAIELNPGHSDHWHRRADTYRELKQWDRALADYSKAIELNPGEPGHLHMRAVTYREMKQWDKAVADYNSAIELDPNNPHSWHIRGSTYEELKQWDKALADYSKAIELDPNTPHFWQGRGRLYLNMERWDEAIADYSKAIELKPDAWGAWDGRFKAYLQLGQQDKALADYSNLIELKPQDTKVRVLRGDCYSHLKDYHKALEDYSAAIELDPNFCEAWYSRGLAHAALGQFDKAALDFAKAVELERDGPYYLYCRALAELGSGDTEKYRRTCATILEQFGQTENAVIAHWVTWTCVLAPDATENSARTIELAELATESSDMTAQNLCTLGAIFYRAGRFNKAVEQLSKLTSEWEKGKEFPTLTSPAYTWFFLAMAHHQLKNTDQSQRYFESAVKRAEEEIADGTWWNRELTLQLLRAEAAELLGIPEETVQKAKEAADEKKK